MFSTLTQRGAKATLDALSFGASDYVTKPANVGSVSKAMDQVKNELIPKIKALCGRSVPKMTPSLSNKPGGLRTVGSVVKTAAINKGKIDILTIGVSTGGPNALADLLPLIPGNLPVPVVIVQHMPPFFTKLLADRLNEKCKLKVKEGEPGQKLEPGTIWIAPGNFHMVLSKNGTNVTINTNQAPLENSCRPAVDVLFRSVCEIYKARTLGVILTGMGQDGLVGCEHIKKVGGQIVVQDEETSVVWGMPGFVAKSGMAEKVLPLKEIAKEIVERVKVGRYAWMPN
jgi:two-component system chemotaxis response regulator CheB